MFTHVLAGLEDAADLGRLLIQVAGTPVTELLEEALLALGQHGLPPTDGNGGGYAAAILGAAVSKGSAQSVQLVLDSPLATQLAPNALSEVLPAAAQAADTQKVSLLLQHGAEVSGVALLDCVSAWSENFAAYAASAHPPASNSHMTAKAAAIRDAELVLQLLLSKGSPRLETGTLEHPLLYVDPKKHCPFYIIACAVLDAPTQMDELLPDWDRLPFCIAQQLVTAGCTPKAWIVADIEENDDDEIGLGPPREERPFRDLVQSAQSQESDRDRLLHLMVQRVTWSPDTHRLFPARFRAAVRTLLLAQHRATEGTELNPDCVERLLRILAFTAWTWV